MKKIVKFLIFLAGLIMYSSCAFALDPAPYSISGEMVMDFEKYGENASFVFNFDNKSNNTVKSFTVIFFLFDEDGNPPITGKANLAVNVKVDVNPKESVQGHFSLDKYLTVMPETPYTVSYMYVSRIIYEAAETWTDPYGLKAVL